MQRLSTLAIAVLACMFSSHAMADWANVGIAYKCDVRHATLSLVATEETSQAPGLVTMPSFDSSDQVGLAKGFTPLKDGKSIVKCNLSGVKLDASFQIWPPQERGMCHGIGVINFFGLYAGKKALVLGESFGDGCFFEYTLVSIQVKRSPYGTSLRKCYAKELSYGEKRELRCSDSYPDG